MLGIHHPPASFMHVPCYFAGRPTEPHISDTYDDIDARYEAIGPFSERGISIHDVLPNERIKESQELVIIWPGAVNNTSSNHCQQDQGDICRICHEEHKYLTVISGDETTV